MSIVADQVTAVEALSLIREGEELLCPKCMANLCTVPENWIKGEPLHGIQCSNESSHFYIRCEDAGVVKDARARMKAIINKDK